LALLLPLRANNPIVTADLTDWASQSHFMSGEIIEWFYHDLAGIQLDESVPAFQKIIIKPAVVGDITWVKASYNSISGKIISEWIRKGSSLILKLTIPPNTTSTLYVSTADVSTVMENGTPALQSSGISLIRFEAPYAIFAVTSGSYNFSSPLN
jgi:alpha-L-rhamnosidase